MLLGNCLIMSFYFCERCGGVPGFGAGCVCPRNIEYNTTKTKSKYLFSGWEPTQSPIECWNSKNYLACLHGCMLCYSFLNDSKATQLAIEDDGLLHELLHLAMKTEICTHQSLKDLEKEIIALQAKFDTRFIERSVDNEYILS